ncbi:transcriptional regulator [Planomonospora parontospora]|uniref:transcriptional regulator n=1 Tax=Planomonospora parontospora TaxID=58119 RepID=UPI0016707C2D|nr:transcriptional regulator [Planomonospora parontospora]GGL56645.1 hypothetical protein GCM10014719_67570 [Planomonospora parontospora subsp. antibiotica]GII19947.1 hypothetical protein Ppa05_66730 [Planomonospora parontospora subsp. antibiotica]
MTAHAAFAATFAALYAAHTFGDHWWGQTHHQALHKGLPGREGRRHCAAHVLQLAAVKAGFLAALLAVTGLRLAPLAVAASLLLDGISHYWADRRTTLARLAKATGKGDFYRLGAPRPGHNDAPHLGTGAYALDQSWHVAWLFVAALIMAA